MRRAVRSVVHAYRRDRAMTKGLIPWWLFMGCWVESWRIARRTRSPEEAKSEASAWGWSHRAVMNRYRIPRKDIPDISDRL